MPRVLPDRGGHGWSAARVSSPVLWCAGCHRPLAPEDAVAYWSRRDPATVWYVCRPAHVYRAASCFARKVGPRSVHVISAAVGVPGAGQVSREASADLTRATPGSVLTYDNGADR